MSATHLTDRIDKVREHFAARSAGYKWASNRVTDPNNEKMRLDFMRNTRVKSQVNLGTGTGVIPRWFREIISKYIVEIDISLPVITTAKYHGLNAILACAEQLPFDSNTFDLITCRQTLHYFDVHEAVSEMVRTSKRYTMTSQIIFASEKDLKWWSKILRIKQHLRKNILTEERLLPLFLQYSFSGKNVVGFPERVRLSKWFKYGVSSKHAWAKVRRLFESASNYISAVNQIVKNGGDIIYFNRWCIALFKKQ